MLPKVLLRVFLVAGRGISKFQGQIISEATQSLMHQLWQTAVIIRAKKEQSLGCTQTANTVHATSVLSAKAEHNW